MVLQITYNEPPVEQFSPPPHHWTHYQRCRWRDLLRTWSPDPGTRWPWSLSPPPSCTSLTSLLSSSSSGLVRDFQPLPHRTWWLVTSLWQWSSGQVWSESWVWFWSAGCGGARWAGKLRCGTCTPALSVMWLRSYQYNRHWEGFTKNIKSKCCFQWWDDWKWPTMT